MAYPFSLRQMTSEDSSALKTLTEQSPDGGTITFGPRFHIPAYDVYASRHGEMLGVVAITGQAVVGSARISFGECQFEGGAQPYALLSSLMVHPDHRRQGIANALAQWGLQQASERKGNDVIYLADIQKGNTASIASAKKWAKQISGRVITSPVPMRSKPVATDAGITIRAAAANELEIIAQHLNSFYQDYNFYRPQTADSLQAWLSKTPLDTPVNHYMVAVDRSNRILAGIGIKEEGRLMSLHISGVPPLIRLANLMLKVIPPDNEMRNLNVDKLWFLPDQLNAARYLWQTVRWEWRERGSSLVCNYDPRSPIPQILQTPPWMPTTSVSIALRSPNPMSETRLIDPII